MSGDAPHPGKLYPPTFANHKLHYRVGNQKSQTVPMQIGEASAQHNTPTFRLTIQGCTLQLSDCSAIPTVTSTQSSRNGQLAPKMLISLHLIVTQPDCKWRPLAVRAAFGKAHRTQHPAPRTRHLERRVCQRCGPDLCADAESAPSRLMALALAMDTAIKHPLASNQPNPLQPTQSPFDPPTSLAIFPGGAARPSAFGDVPCDILNGNRFRIVN
ncbi:hypothetical protein M5D96_006762 [Drosophila gunungcola]|uniref:Uncharacterized protein n=1 Tax=Drosophila gunungcola TaxID=103775 RepID=A0A9Q0BR78_9MUSC|nr:hypothetical protein M5D96_006762 [Drosophila gunungcola]